MAKISIVISPKTGLPVKAPDQVLRRNRAKEAGLCINGCPTPAREGFADCFFCHGKRCQYTKDRKEKGICVSCGARPAVQGKASCQTCLDDQKAKYKTRVGNGKCFYTTCEMSCVSGRRYCSAHQVKALAAQIRYREKLKRIIYAAYGDQCACCGEREVKFLCLDHVDGGGKKDRKRFGSGGMGFYRMVINEGFPDRLQLLCHNCNMAKGLYGQCPHKERE